MKRTARAATCAAAVLLASALTGCGSSGKSDSGHAPSDATSASAAAAKAHPKAAKVAQATVATKSVGNLGTILVNGKDRTLYLFLADKKNTSNCTGTCAAAWPPLLTNGTALAGKGADSKLLGTATRSGGVKQATYNGHPLYLYIGDTKAGQSNGQGLNQFGALWYVVNAKGKQVTS
ncbi:Predicted lipoprotein with conserved Yx(FWY)xxD motif [Actinacidiphila yanglinensis]|uniref:Predicted lipoprotein with conserved Yx(FWY)xxD motif n=1 Tax=Actinacidiphila yanglinensis TaxID=310779 RepID=A0A1H6B748_9ACTN|nr:hypothetical protein [Actinacidiphila yanglinensis]SEG56669.1 Predicted lipoprotein with conserved Yx(FWY)xxD motif [Actinacidiphila yanglinensis]